MQNSYFVIWRITNTLMMLIFRKLNWFRLLKGSSSNYLIIPLTSTLNITPQAIALVYVLFKGVNKKHRQDNMEYRFQI